MAFPKVGTFQPVEGLKGRKRQRRGRICRVSAWFQRWRLCLLLPEGLLGLTLWDLDWNLRSCPLALRLWNYSCRRTACRQRLREDVRVWSRWPQRNSWDILSAKGGYIKGDRTCGQKEQCALGVEHYMLSNWVGIRDRVSVPGFWKQGFLDL